MSNILVIKTRNGGNLNLYFNRELSTDDFINNSLKEINLINKRYLK